MENRESEDDEVSRRMWEVVETKARKTRAAKAKRRRKEKSKSKEKKSKSKSKERKKEEIKRKQDNGCEESSGRVGNLG